MQPFLSFASSFIPFKHQKGQKKKETTMSAFVPALGLCVKSSSTFTPGITPLTSTRDASTRRAFVLHGVTSMAADGDAGNTAVVIEADSTKNSVKIDLGMIDKAKTIKNSTSKANLKPSMFSVPGQLPKFYNPSTARSQFSMQAMGQNNTLFDVRRDPDAVPTNRRQNPNDTFRNMDPYTDDPVWARPGWSSDEARVAARQAIRWILGNANLFESEVAELSSSISCLAETADMKEFIRALGLSSAYRKRFFEPVTNVRFVELNFKHFLGRAPRTQAEISEHIQIINQQGYNAEINSHIDSEEYAMLWGESRIPQPNFRGGHPYNADMNKLAVLKGGFATSDRNVKVPYLPSGDNTFFASFSILKGLPEAWRGENRARADAGFVSDFPEAFWNPTPPAIVSDELAWKMRYGKMANYWYKDSIVYKQMAKPVLTHPEEEKKEAEAVLKYGSTMARMYVN